MTDRLPDHILNQAIAWAVKLESGQADHRDREACRAWRMEDDRHETAWQAIGVIDREFEQIPQNLAGLAHSTLEKAPEQLSRLKARRRVVKTIILGGLCIGLGYGIRQLPFLRPKRQIRQPHVTLKGQRRTICLPDDSRIFLNTASQIYILFSRDVREIQLTSGEIFVETGMDSEGLGSKRPFWVASPDARFEAVGTRFNLRRSKTGTQVYVAQGQVNIHPLKKSEKTVQVLAGQTFMVDAGPDQGPRAEHQPVLEPGAWVKGTLVVKNMSLARFAIELSRYHNGTIRCEPDAANFAISGVFQLKKENDPVRILSVLSQTLNVTVEKEGKTGYRIRKKTIEGFNSLIRSMGK
ncbi:FecR domain-containing protein [uncultured Desulfobacter sp.]|uniref:FecR family protein n=1 Tax=uncultured Desulfobacter sp. TaxID=240139 RepID=UPI0029F49530|nr:FecR domain-containing protein [uncultured Desulfobacter sp.]